MGEKDSNSADAPVTTWTGPTAAKFEKCAARHHPLDRLTDNNTHSKAYSEYFDPCQEAAQRSIRCLHRNGGDREMCTDFFQYGHPHLSLTLLPYSNGPSLVPRFPSRRPTVKCAC